MTTVIDEPVAAVVAADHPLAGASVHAKLGLVAREGRLPTATTVLLERLRAALTG